MNFLAALLFFAAAAAAQPHTWTVDNARAADGDGSPAAPFRTIAAALRAAQNGDVIRVLHGSGPYREPVVLREGETLTGEGTPVIDVATGDALTIAANCNVEGVVLRAAAGGHALVAANAGGNVSVGHTKIEGDVTIDGGSGALTFDASPLAASLSVRNRAGGKVVFRNGSSVTGAGVDLRGNQGEIEFADPLRLTADGAVALHVQSSGRLTMSSPASVISAKRAAAVEIADTGIAIQLQSASCDAAGAAVPSGIVIDNAAGTFRLAGGTITGTSARAVSIRHSSGVTLQNVVIEKTAAAAKATLPCANLTAEKNLDCAAAVHMVGANDITLDGVRIEGSGQIGIFGDDVAGLTFRGVTVTGAGDELGEHGIVLRALHGRSAFSQVTVKNSASRQLFILNRQGDGALEIHGSRFEGGPPPNGEQAVLLQLEGEAKFTLSIADSDFANTFSDAVQVVCEGSAKGDVSVTGSRFAAVNSAMNLVASGEGRLDYRLTGNTASGAKAAAINVSLSTSGASSGTIATNVIGKSGVAGSGAACGGCTGIAVTASHNAVADVAISDNTVQQVDGPGIRVLANGGARLRAVVRHNTVREPADATVPAIAVQSGSRPADQTHLCLDLAENDIKGGWDVSLTSKGGVPMRLLAASAAAQALEARNKGAAVKLNAAAGGSFAAAASCGEK